MDLVESHSPPDWKQWTPAMKKSWAENLAAGDPLALLAAPHWTPPTPGFNRNLPLDVLDRMEYARKRRFAYGHLYAEASRKAALVPDSDGALSSMSQRTPKDQARLIREAAQESAWFYLLFDGLASPEKGAREKLFWEQARQVEKDPRPIRWCQCADPKLPERFRALWTSE